MFAYFASLFSQLPTSHRRRIQSLLGLGMLFAIIGAANTYIGYRKQHQYASEMIALSHDSATSVADLPFTEHSSTKRKQKQQIARLESGIEFYSFVMLGGKFFLAIGGAFFLWSLLSMRVPMGATNAATNAGQPKA